jgi:transcriptional antiterminator RfaH
MTHFDDEEFHWFCVKTKPRSESAARRMLMRDVGIEVFCPMLRFERARRSGKVKVTEAMFPGYVFGKFNFRESHRHVAATLGVATIIRFGGIPAIVPDEIIAELRASIIDQETIEIPTTISVGDEVQLLKGAFSGIRALVTQVLPAQQRVKVLLEILGMEREVEIETASVLPKIRHPLAAGH